MIIAAAQTIPSKHNLGRNLDDHYRFVNMAADHGAQLIIFPEMSLTGYEREAARDLSLSPNDQRLAPLRLLAKKRNIIILAGAPILLESGLHIGMFILKPDHTEMIYTKQYLHEGEENYFVPGLLTEVFIDLENERMSPAICADITHPEHPARAASNNSRLYLASIFYTPSGIDQGISDLGSYAKILKMNVLMSNFGGASYSLASGGKSAFWQNNGEMVGGFEGAGEGILIVERNDMQWRSTVYTTF